MKIHIKELIKNKCSYPSWTTSSSYPLKYKEFNNECQIYYMTKSNKKITRTFPKIIKLTPILAYVFGFLKGEGPTSLGKSNYRRLTITNTDPIIMGLTLKELEKAGLFRTAQLTKNSSHIMHHTKTDLESTQFWSDKIKLPKSKFKCFKAKPGRNPFGVCHIYISDVLLRRIIDLIHEKICNK